MLVAFNPLSNDILEGDVLTSMVFVGITVAAIHYDMGRQLGFTQRFLRGGYGTGIVVGATASTTHDQMAVLVAPGFNNRRLPVVVNAQERLGSAGRYQGIHRRLRVAVGAILEANRH